MTWKGYSNENDENAKIIMMLRKNKRTKNRSDRPGFEFLKAAHATCSSEFQKDTPAGTKGNQSQGNTQRACVDKTSIFVIPSFKLKKKKSQRKKREGPSSRAFVFVASLNHRAENSQVLCWGRTKH